MIVYEEKLSEEEIKKMVEVMEKTNPAAYERYLEICVLHGGKKISFYRTLTYGDPFDVDFNT